MLIGKDRRCTVRAVHVQPQLFRDKRRLLQPSRQQCPNSWCRRWPRRRTASTRSAILLNHRSSFSGSSCVGWLQGSAAVPSVRCPAVQQICRASGAIPPTRTDGQSADRCNAFFHCIREVGRQCEGHPAEIGFVSSAGERAVEFGAPAHALGNPAHGFEFDFRSQLRSSQRRQLRIQAPPPWLRRESHISRRRVHQAKVVGAGHMKTRWPPSRQRLLPVHPQDRLRPQAGTFKCSIAPLLSRKLNRTIGQGTVVLVNKVDETMANSTPCFRIKIEAHRKLDENLEERMQSKRCRGDGSCANGVRGAPS